MDMPYNARNENGRTCSVVLSITSFGKAEPSVRNPPFSTPSLPPTLARTLALAVAQPSFPVPTNFLAIPAGQALRRPWPVFEVEDLDPVRATLGGREVRCRTCGGHLGDVFNDGCIYVGSSAAKTGKRYCIDGAALIYKPEDGGPDVYGDEPPPNKVIRYEPTMYRDPR